MSEKWTKIDKNVSVLVIDNKTASKSDYRIIIVRHKIER